MKIYRSEVEIYDLVIDKATKLSQKLMGEDLITLSVIVDAMLDIRVGDYTTFEGHQYEINRPVKVKKLSAVEYRYDIEFESCYYRTLDKIVLINGKSETSLYGTLEDFIALIIANLNTIDTGWIKGTVDETQWTNLTVDGTTCKALLDTLASTFSVEYSVIDKTISAHERIEAATELSFEVGKAKGLYELTRQKVDNENTITRAYFFGSTRNIDYNYRSGASRLVFVTAEGKSYLENTSEYSKIVESKVVFEDIYPRFTGVVGTVSTDKKTITDSTIDFDINDYLISGTTAKIVFTSGDLMGMEFELSAFDADTKAITFIESDESSGVSYPNASVYASAGDTYTLVDITMPTAYLEDAEALLYTMGLRWLNYYSQLRVKYTLELDARYIRDNAISLNIGDIVNIKDAALGIDKDIRIVALTKNIDGSAITAEISNYREEKQLNRLQQALNDTLQQLIDLRSQANSSNTSITNIIEQLDGQTLSFDQITGLPMDNAALAEYLSQIGDSSTVDTSSRIISGDVIWRSGLTFDSTDIIYKILGIGYKALATSITLEDADPTYPRVDVFYVDTYSNLCVKTGTPAESPLEPVLSANELFVTSVMVNANALTPDGIEVEKVYDELAETEWTPTSYEESGKTTVNTGAITDPYNGTVHAKMAIAIPDEEVVYPDHYIGQEYQGGKIFYIDPTSGGKKGIIAAKQDTSSNAKYSLLSGYSIYTTGATDASIGAGQANSLLMLANDAAAGQAIKQIDQLVIDEYDDWYMPSELELYTMWQRQYQIGGFDAGRSYWSSTEKDWNDARCVDWWNGKRASVKKNGDRCIRAIRDFDDTGLPSSNPVENYVPDDTAIVFSSAVDYTTKSAIISLRMKTSKAWNANTILVFETYYGAVKTGTVAMSPSTNLFGFDHTNTDDYQLVVINISNFAVSLDTLNALKIAMAGNWPNNIELEIDDIRYQYTENITNDQVIIQVQGKVLYADKWTQVGSIWEYVYEDATIKDSSIVDLIPNTEDIDIITDAGIFPETISEAGKVHIYAARQPEDDIRVTINISEAAL